MISLFARTASFLILATTLLCLGCPSGSGQSGKSSSQQASGAGGKATADKPARLALDDINLGQSPEEVLSRFENRGEDYHTTEIWAVEGLTGVIASEPLAEERTGAEEAIFLEGEMISFTISSDGGEEAYLPLVDALTGKFGTAEIEPPEWFLSTEWGSSFVTANSEGTIFWLDAELREAVLAYYSAEEGNSYFGLLRPEQLMDALIETASAQMEAVESAGQMDDPFGEGAGFSSVDPDAELVAVAGLSWLEFDGLTVGLGVAELRETYSLLGWMTYTVWIEDELRGMLGANSRNADNLPADSCFIGAGQLMGFTRNTAETPEEFDARVAELEEMLGAGTALPQAWVLESNLGEMYVEPGDSEAAWWWHDEETRSVLMAYYDYEGMFAAYLLAQVDNFPVISRQVELTWGSGL